MADSIFKKHKLNLDIEAGLQLNDTQKNAFAANIRKISSQLQDSLDKAIREGISKDIIKDSMKDVVQQFNDQFRQLGIKTIEIDIDKIDIDDKPFKLIATQASQNFAEAFKLSLKGSGIGDALSAEIVDSIDIIGGAVDKIFQRIEQRAGESAKKSVHDIEESIKALNKLPAKDTVKKAVSVDKIESTLADSEKTKQTSSKTAMQSVVNAQKAYEESVADNNPWVAQYKYLLDFVSKYDRLTTQAREKIDKEMPSIRKMYEDLSPMSGAVKETLQDYVVTIKGEGELSQYKNQPWAREKTLQAIKQTLANGISVKGGEDDGKNNKSSATESPIDAESEVAKAARLAREQEEAALREAERKRLDQERIAEAERAAAEQRRIAEEKAIAEARKVYAENIYRVVYEPYDEEDRSRDERKSAYGGVEIWTSSKDVANTYADGQENPAMLHGSISAKNAYLIDAGGAKWNEFSKMKVLTPVGADAEGKTKFDKTDLKSIFPELFKRMDAGEFGQDEDVQTELYRLIKELGYDSIITKNVIDSNNAEMYREQSTIYSIIDDRILKVIDAFAVEEQDDRGVTTFEETPRRENIPGYYKMPDVTSDGDISVEELERQKQLQEEVLKITKDINATSAHEAVIKEELVDLIEKYYKICVKLGNAQSMAIEFKGQSYNKSELGDLQSQLRGYIYRYAENFGDDVSMFGTKKLQKIASDGISKYQSLKPHVDELNKSLEKKNALEASDNSPIEVAETNAETDALAKQNEELKENIQLKSQDNAQDVIAPSSQDNKLDTTDEQTQLNNLKTAIGNVEGAVDEKTAAFSREETRVKEIVRNEIEVLGGLESKISAINKELDKLNQKANTDIGSEFTINVNHKAEDVEGSGISINQEDLKNTLEAVLRNVTINTRVADNVDDSKPIRVIVDNDLYADEDKNLYSDAASAENVGQWRNQVSRVLDRIKLHTHTTARRIRDDVVPKIVDTKVEHTNPDIKSVLERIQAHTAKIGLEPQTSANDVDSTIAVISKNVAEINTKIVKGTRAPNKDKANTTKIPTGRDAQILAERKATQRLSLDKFKAELETSGKMTEDVAKKIRGLAISLGMVKDSKGLTRWGEKFKQEKLSVGIADIENKEEKQAKKDALKTQEETIKRLNKLYQEYGVLVERASAATGHFGEQLQNEVADKSKEIIALRESMDFITTEMFDGFDAAFDRGRQIESTKQYEAIAKKSDADEATRLKNIANLEKEIGKLRADADAATNVGVQNALEEEIQLRKQLIELQRQGLEMDALDEAYYRQAAANRTMQAKSEATQEIKDVKDAFKQAEKDAKKQAAEDKRQAKRNAMFGKAGNAIGRAENIWMSAQGEDEPLPPGLSKQVEDLYNKMVALRAEQDEVRTAESVTPEQQKALREHTIEMNALTNEVSELYSEYQKLSGANVDESKTMATTLTGKSSLSAYEAELKQYVKSIEHGKAQIKGFDATTKTLTYTVKTGKNEFTEYTAAVRRADGALVSVRGATKRTETFLEATKRKMKELTSYMSGMALFSRIGQELRRGVQYVREIDLALTELKKVTNETEEEYDQFLKTAAKTGARLGTTISAVTEATSTFAKLGYTMEQATEMAESAIVYKNVGDNIESTGDAADSIISTMKGFGLEVTESMAIVDRFNEVGNRFAITSQGIGEALRLSASALSEGSNSLDESIGLITAANEVVNDPSSVGKISLPT